MVNRESLAQPAPQQAVLLQVLVEATAVKVAVVVLARLVPVQIVAVAVAVRVDTQVLAVEVLASVLAALQPVLVVAVVVVRRVFIPLFVPVPPTPAHPVVAGLAYLVKAQAALLALAAVQGEMAASGVLLGKQAFQHAVQLTLVAVVEACTVPVVVAAVITGVAHLLVAMGPSESSLRAPQGVSQVRG